MAVRKDRKRFSGIANSEEQSHTLFHLREKDFPGLSFEARQLGLALLTLLKNGTEIGNAPKFNFMEGNNITITTSKLSSPDNPDIINIQISSIGSGGGNIIPLNFERNTWPKQPAALTEFLGKTDLRSKIDLSGATKARLVAHVITAGAATAALRVQYSTNEIDWYYLDGDSGPSVAINATGTRASSWVDLTAAAKADVFIRLVGINGDAVAKPTFALIALQLY